MSGTFTNPTTPNQADYTTFLQTQVGVGPLYLPTDSPWIPNTLTVAQEIVSLTLACVAPTIYTLAVYNLATDRLFTFAIDVEGQTFFKDWRQKLELNAFSPGLVTSTSDQGTAAGFMVPEIMKNLTIASLRNLKTPWGRQYLEFAQSYGTTIWGLS